VTCNGISLTFLREMMDFFLLCGAERHNNLIILAEAPDSPKKSETILIHVSKGAIDV
jgi:hypothetical protein